MRRRDAARRALPRRVPLGPRAGRRPRYHVGQVGRDASQLPELFQQTRRPVRPDRLCQRQPHQVPFRSAFISHLNGFYGVASVLGTWTICKFVTTHLVPESSNRNFNSLDELTSSWAFQPLAPSLTTTPPFKLFQSSPRYGPLKNLLVQDDSVGFKVVLWLPRVLERFQLTKFDFFLVSGRAERQADVLGLPGRRRAGRHFGRAPVSGAFHDHVRHVAGRAEQVRAHAHRHEGAAAAARDELLPRRHQLRLHAGPCTHLFLSLENVFLDLSKRRPSATARPT